MCEPCLFSKVELVKVVANTNCVMYLSKFEDQLRSLVHILCHIFLPILQWTLQSKHAIKYPESVVRHVFDQIDGIEILIENSV